MYRLVIVVLKPGRPFLLNESKVTLNSLMGNIHGYERFGKVLINP